MRRLIVTVTLLLLAGRSGRTQDTVSARSFVQQVYAKYSDPDWQHQEARLTKYYTSSLNRMIVADAERHPGEISNLDFDPICDCQDPGDPGDLKIRSIKLAAIPVRRMKAAVSITIMAEPLTVTLFLLETPFGWRIDDISSEHMRSLRGLLARSDKR